MAKLPLVGLIRFVKFVTNFLKIHCHCQMPWNSINFYTNYLIFASFVSICCFLFPSDYYLVLNQKAFETYPNFSVSCISENTEFFYSFEYVIVRTIIFLKTCRLSCIVDSIFLLWVGREFNFLIHIFDSKCLGCVYVQRESKSSDFKGVAGI